MGKVKDLVTGEMYHLEMNPPPLHDTMWGWIFLIFTIL
jgi:hypothetical protein